MWAIEDVGDWRRLAGVIFLVYNRVNDRSVPGREDLVMIIMGEPNA